MKLSDNQQRLLDLMVRLDKFFKDNDLDYYLLGGSLIGALRHNGFIPWDDDMDIMVTREVYEKLIEMSDHLPFDDIEFVCYENTPAFCKPYAMFSQKNDTCTSYSRFFWGGKCMGTAIDVFVMDDMNSEDHDEFMHALLLHQDVIYRIKLSSEKVIDYKDEYLRYKDREKTEGRDVVIRELRSRLKSFAERDDCDIRCVTTWGRSNLRTYNIEWVQEPKYVDYEGYSFPVPTHPEACLRLQYGHNWYMIPTDTEQITHNLCINPDMSYNNYYLDMDRFIDWENAYEGLDIRKRIRIESVEPKRKVDQFRYKAAAARVIMRYDDLGDEGRRELIRSGRYEEFIDSMSELFARRAWFAGNGLAGSVESDIYREWTRQLIYCGRYYDAIKVNRSFLAADDSDKKKEIVKLLDQVTRLAEFYQDRDSKGMKEALAAVPEDMQDSLPDCILAKARLSEDRYGDKAFAGPMAELCRNYLKTYPHNYDIMKLLGDLLWNTGSRDEASELYKTVNEYSRNGLDLQDLIKRFGFEPGYLRQDLIVNEQDAD